MSDVTVKIDKIKAIQASLDNDGSGECVICHDVFDTKFLVIRKNDCEEFDVVCEVCDVYCDCSAA